MLEELSKHHKKWRSMAYKICNSNTMADDITQDMYIKLHETGKSFNDVNDWYVWVTLRNIFLNITKKVKPEISIELFHNIEDMCDGNETLQKRKEINKALDELSLWDREILINTSETSLRKLSKETGISVMTLFHSKRIALEKLKNLL
jgi:RNA polymerase sigma factor (sigma-70 family)